MAGIGPPGSEIPEALLDSNAEMYKGADFNRNYQWLIDGLPAIDLSTATGTSEIRRNGVAILNPTVTITDGPNAKFQISLTAAQTGSVTPVIATSTVTICSPMDFEFQDKHEVLSFIVNLSMSGNTSQMIRGFIRFYP